MKLEEAKNLKHGQTIFYKRTHNADGTIRKPITLEKWRVNGKVQTWKRSPERIRVPLKNGLYNYNVLDEDNVGFFEIN
uniref:Uncharacterized protein n=1 Tax=viral metagenome TaxID=1070528 RepID=A0A6M3LPT9_9ZZZZ